jgi:hypothetical protein
MGAKLLACGASCSMRMKNPDTRRWRKANDGQK